MNGMTDQGAAVPAAESEAPVRQPYVAPTLTHLGDIRELTLGASPGIGDSGGATTFKCPGCP
jgi:hypothetical protein